MSGRQVEHQRCSRIGGVQKNHKEKQNKILNEHPVYEPLLGKEFLTVCTIPSGPRRKLPEVQGPLRDSEHPSQVSLIKIITLL